MSYQLASRTQVFSFVLCLFLAGAAIAGAMLQQENAKWFLLFAGVFGLAALLILSGHGFENIGLSEGDRSLQISLIKMVSPPNLPSSQPSVTDEDLIRRQKDAEQQENLKSPSLKIVVATSIAELRPLPGSDASLPVLRLDKNFHVLDWNEAFGLIFDNSLEGYRGTPLFAKWVHYLDNNREVLRDWNLNLRDLSKAPQYWQRSIKFRSGRYGEIEASMRMYQVHGPEETIESWFCVFDVANKGHFASRFHRDLIAHVRNDLLWTEYALSYDPVLNNSKAYPQLLAEILGSPGAREGLPMVGARSKVLDLGCGSGNVTLQLAKDSSERHIVAIDKNAMMLEIARTKCEKHLSAFPRERGVTLMRQDVTILNTVPDNFFDTAILTNVLYAVSNAEKCLTEVFRVMKAGADIRLTGPRRDTDTKKLLDTIKEEITEAGLWKELEEDYLRVYDINMYWLKQSIERWDVDQVAAMLTKAGFVGENGAEIWRRTNVYADQAMMLRAFKPQG